jgi:hypothetical protein
VAAARGGGLSGCRWCSGPAGHRLREPEPGRAAADGVRDRPAVGRGGLAGLGGGVRVEGMATACGHGLAGSRA